jgi:hypothetical protein
VRVDRVVVQHHLAAVLARLVQGTEQHVLQLAAQVKGRHVLLLAEQAGHDLAPQRAAHFGRQQDRVLGGFRAVQQGGGDRHDVLQRHVLGQQHAEHAQQLGVGQRLVERAAQLGRERRQAFHDGGTSSWRNSSGRYSRISFETWVAIALGASTTW